MNTNDKQFWLLFYICLLFAACTGWALLLLKESNDREKSYATYILNLSEENKILRSKLEPKWPSTNTLQLEISEDVFKSQNYSNFYRWVDVLKTMEAQVVVRGGSNFAIRIDYDLYTFTKQVGQKTRVIYRN